MSRTGRDITGERFGKLVVTGFAGYGQAGRQRVALWECRCDCGNTCRVEGYLLKSGRRKSCGCDRIRPGKGDYLERQYDGALEAKREAFQKGDTSRIVTLEDWVYVWLRNVLPHVVKETTIRMYAETMERHILPALGDRKLEDLTEEAVSGWLRGLESMPLAGTQNGHMTEGTVRNTLSVLSGGMKGRTFSVMRSRLSGLSISPSSGSTRVKSALGA